METKVHSANTKIWASYHIPRKLSHSKMNEQSGFNAEQIEKDRIDVQRVKLFEV
jgi:hypothetical protein